MGRYGGLFSSSLQRRWEWSFVGKLSLKQRAERLAAAPSAYAGSRPPGLRVSCLVEQQVRQPDEKQEHLL